MKRRTFLKNTAASVAAVSVLNEPNQKINKMFVHHVFFWLKNPANEEEKAKLIEGLEKLSKVPTIRSYQIGVPASTNRSVIERSYSISWLCFFDNLEAEEIYQKHPIHLKFVEECASLWEKVVVYDAEPYHKG